MYRTHTLPKEPNETRKLDDYNATAITRTNLTAENFGVEGWTKNKKLVFLVLKIAWDTPCLTEEFQCLARNKKRCCIAMLLFRLDTTLFGTKW